MTSRLPARLSVMRNEDRPTTPGRLALWVLLITGFILLSLAAGARAEEGGSATASGTASSGRERTDVFSASGNLRSLDVENVSGRVEISSGPSFSATVKVRVKGGTEAEAKRVLERTKTVFRNEDGALVLYVQEPGTTISVRGHRFSVHSDHGRDRYHVEAQIRAIVPLSVAVNVSAVNGDVVTESLAGGQEVSTVNGAIHVTGARQALKLSTVNGGIDAAMADLPNGARVEGSTVNGRIVLRLPASAGFRFEGRTMSGDIVSTFPFPAAAGERDRERMHEDLRRKRDEIREREGEVREKLREKERERQEAEGKDRDTIEIDLSELNEAMAELSREMAEMGREMAQTIRVNVNRSYEGTVGNGASTVRLSTLNGRIALLAEGTSEEAARPLVSRKTAEVVTIPPIHVPKIVIREGPATPPAPPVPPVPPVPQAPAEEEPESIVRGDVTGDFEANLPVGDIVLGQVSGRVKVSTASGEIRLRGAGKGAELSTAGGDIHVDRVTGDLKAVTYGGDIGVESVTGQARLETSGGDVVLRSARGDVTARTGGGDITLRKVRGSVKAQTSGGDILCEIGALEGGVDLSTTGGDVTLILPSDVKADVTIHATGGDPGGDYIVSEFPGVTISRRGGMQFGEGKLNGGGPKVVIRASSGTVTLRKAPSS